MTYLPRSVLGAALAVVLAASPVRAAVPDKLLPAGAEFVVSVNVKQIVSSEIIKQYALEQIKQALDGADAKKLLGDLGIDPLKDVSRVVFAGSGNDQSDTKVLAIVHGKFDPEKLFKAAEAQTKKNPDRFSMIKDGKDLMFKFQPEVKGNPVYATVVNETTLVAGTDRKLVAAALAAESKTTSVSKELAALIGKMDDKASVWMIGITKDKLGAIKPGAKKSPLPQEWLTYLEKADHASLVIRITADIMLDVTMGMKDTDTADEFGKFVDEQLTQVKGFLPFFAASKPQLKPLVDAVKAIKPVVKDRNVSVSAKLPGSAIGQLLKLDE